MKNKLKNNKNKKVGKLNFEFLLRNVICNLVIAIIVFSIFWAGISSNFDSGAVEVSNSEYNGTIYAGDKMTNKLSLMINVYWGNEFLVQMLDTLKKYDIKTTFFVGGSWAENNEDLLKKIYEDGHEVASHGYSHKEHGKLDYYNNLEEMKRCHKVIKQILSIDMTLFAPPGGSYNSSTIKASEEMGYKTIMWTRDTIDWRDKNEQLIFSRATSNMSGGDLILMHPTSSTAAVLEKIILYARDNDLKITKVSDVIS